MNTFATDGNNRDKKLFDNYSGSKSSEKMELKEFIKELGEEIGYLNKVSGDIVVKHYYTQKDIATLIGTSRPTLNNLLKELKQEAFIEFSRGEIVIKMNFVR